MSLRSYLRRLAALVRRNALERDLDDEIAAHLELAEREGLASGLSAEEARRQARIRFGAIAAVREHHRDRRGLPLLTELGRDLRLALRSLRRDREFTLGAGFVMAVAIGAGTAIFSVVDAVVLKGLPYEEADRIAAVLSIDTRNAVTFGGGTSTTQTFLDWQRLQQSFEHLALVESSSFQVRNDRNEPTRVRAARVLADFFGVFRLRPYRGRLFTPQDHQPGQARVVVLGYRYWAERFGSDEKVIDSTIQLDGTPWRIVGVLPSGFEYPPAGNPPTDVYTPYELREQDRLRGGSHNYNGIGIGRLKAGVSVAAAHAELNTIAETLDRQFPEWEPGRRAEVVPLHQRLVGNSRTWMYLLLGAVSLLLLIACANVANLTLVRAAARAREVAVRRALGASRMRIARALVIESVALSLLAGLVGIGVASGGIHLLRAWVPEGLPRVSEIAMDVRVLGIALLVASITGVVFALIPAIPITRSVSLTAMKDHDRSTTGTRTGRRLRNALVALEVAVAVVLVAGAGLFIVSFAKVIGIAPGFDYRNVVVMDLSFRFNPAAGQNVQEWGVQKERQLEEAREALSLVPNVINVAAVSGGLPLSTGYARVSITLPERGEIGDDDGNVDLRRITPSYLDVLGIPVVRGRTFTAEDRGGAPLVAIVNESAAARYWPGQDAVGQRFVVQDKERTVVGIVGDIRQYGLEKSARQGVFVPFPQEPTSGAQFLVKVAGEIDRVVPALKDVIWSFNRDQFLPSRASTLEGAMEQLLAERRFNMTVLSILGSIALVMVAAGVFSVIACVVSERHREIGLRMALGARPATILAMIFKQVSLLLIVGCIAGGIVAWYLMTLAQAFLFQVSASDVRVMGVALVLLAVVSVAAATIPARRAAKISPLEALRS